MDLTSFFDTATVSPLSFLFTLFLFFVQVQIANNNRGVAPTMYIVFDVSCVYDTLRVL